MPKILHLKDIDEFKSFLIQANKMSKASERAGQGFSVELKIRPDKVEVSASDTYSMVKKSFKLAKKPDFTGKFYLSNIKENREAKAKRLKDEKIKRLEGQKITKQNSFDIKPYLVNPENYKIIGEEFKKLKINLVNHFEIGKDELIKAVKIGKIFNETEAQLKVKGQKAVFYSSSKINGKHKQVIKVFNHSRKYSRLIFNPLRLLDILKNQGQAMLTIFSDNKLLKIGENYLALINAASH